MSIPGNDKPGAFSGEQKQQSIHLVSAIPIKKRRFPVIQAASPAPEEKDLCSELSDSKNKQEYSIPSEGSPMDGGISTASLGNSDMSKTLPLVIKREVTTTSKELGQVSVGILASKPLEAKPQVSLGLMGKIRQGINVLSNEIPSVKGVPESFRGPITKNVKQEVISEKVEGACRDPTSLMNVELSLGQKDPPTPALKCQNSEASELKPQKVDRSLLGLGPTNEKLVLRDSNVRTIDNASSQVSINRTNWDLNTTMDAWECSLNSDACTPGVVGIGGFSKAYSCSSVVSSFTTAGMNSLCLGKGNHISNDGRSSSSNSTVQCKTHVSLGLGLSVPGKEPAAIRKFSSLVVKSASTCGNPNLNLKPLLQSSVNMNQAVKSEPVDENLNHDHSIGSCNSSNMGLSKSVSIKKEPVNSNSVEIDLPSFVDRAALSGSIKPEMFEGNQEVRKLDSTIRTPSVVMVMQHPESSISSVLPVSLMPQCSSTSGLSIPSEATTSGNLSNQSQNSFPVKAFNGCSDSPNKQIACVVSKHVSQDDKRYILKNSNLHDLDKSKLARVDEHASESCQSDDIAGDFDKRKKTNVSTKRFEDSSGSDCKSIENHAIGKTLQATGDKVCNNEDEGCNEGESQEHLQHLTVKNLIVERKKAVNLQRAGFVSRNLPPSVSPGDQNINDYDFEEELTAKKMHDKSVSDAINICASVSCEPQREDNSSQKVSGQVLEATVGVKRSMFGVEDLAKNVCCNGPTSGSTGADNEHGDDAGNKFSTEICLRENKMTWSKTEASLNCNDAAKDCNSAANKSRIINLSLTSVMTPPGKTRSIPNKLLTSRFGKQRYSSHGGAFQRQENRDDIYTGVLNKWAKGRAHGQFHRNPRPGFMRGKGRISGQFGSLRREWLPDHDLKSKTYECPSDSGTVIHRNTSNISDVELEFNDYSMPQDTTALVNTRRQTISNEFHSVRRNSSRLSAGDRDRTVARGMPMMRRLPRNMSLSQCTIEDGSNMMEQCGKKFMRQLSDDIIDPVCNHSDPIYENFDNQFARGNRNFSNFHRKGYPQVHSKSPVRSRTRSPGPWQSPRRRSPNGPPEVTQHRSMTIYQMGRQSSPGRACFHEEIVATRREPPSYIARHPNDFRDAESGQDLVHSRPHNLNRRGSPAQLFPRIARRMESTLDSREMGNGDDEFINAPLNTNKFHEIGDDAIIDERRKFVDRRRGPPSFHPNYRGDNVNFHFHQNNGPRPYRFCPDMETEIVNRSNVQEREFDGHTKLHNHHPMGPTRRIRNIEEQVGEVWHDDGFCETRVKRRRY